MTNSPDKIQPKNGWAEPAEPRLPLPTVRERGIAFRLISGFSRFFGRPELPNVFPMLNTNRRLFWPWLFFASRLMPFGRLSHRDRELIILRVGFNCRSRYEFAQHLEIAQRLGVSDAEILSSTQAPSLCQDDKLQALYMACDQICNKEAISAEVWQRLSQHFDAKRLVEILMLIGHYQMVAALLINTKVPLEKDIEERLLRFSRSTPLP